MSGVIPPFPNTLSWPGAQLKHRDNFVSSVEHGDVGWIKQTQNSFSKTGL
jgi:hypothetical protein